MFGRIRYLIKRNIEIILFMRKGDKIQIGPHSEIRRSQYIKCGNNIHIGENSKLLCFTGLNNSGPVLDIGNNFSATRRLTIQCANKIVIGKNVLIASDVFIIDYNHGCNPLTDNYLENPLGSSGGIIIEDGCWIGNNCIILPDVKIGKKCIIGAGAVVTRDIPPYSMAVGNPARVIKQYDFETNCWISKELGR